jgi:alpha-tubulin suppressor-like RCC1 family protein
MVTDDKRTKCWGGNHYGALGNGDRNDRGGQPNQMGANLPYTDWAGNIKYAHAGLNGAGTFALMEDGSVQTVGNYHVAVTCQEVAQWSQLTGQGSNGATFAITIDLGSKVVKDLYAQNYACIVADDDKYYCWGYNNNGQLGLGHSDHIGDGAGECGDNLVATDLGTGLTVKRAYLGSDHQCVQFTDDRVKCWGRNSHGVLGMEKADSHWGNQPNQMGDNLPFVDLGDYVPRQLFPMSYSTCMWTTNDKAVCWGKGTDGALGLGTTGENIGDGPGEMGNNLQPVDFGFDRFPVDMSCAVGHCCVILNDDAVVCWGPCWHGGSQCGNSASAIGDSPDEVGENFVAVDFTGLPSPKKLMTMGQNSCAQFEDNTFACWGRNYYGELGQGNRFPTISLVPLMVDTGAQMAPICEASTATTGGGASSPQASVAVPRGKTFCYRYLDMETKMADLTEQLKAFDSVAFQNGGPESQQMTCVMKQMSREWPHAVGQPEPNQKHRRPQVKFDVKNGEVTYVQSRRRTPRGGYKNQCYALGNHPSVQMSTGVDDPVSTAIRADSAWCNPCADIHSQQFSTMDGSDTVVVTTTTFVTWECKVWYGDDNKSKDSVTKCKAPRGIKCRKGSYTIYEGDEERNVNYGTLRCMPKNEYTDNKWSDQCEE